MSLVIVLQQNEPTIHLGLMHSEWGTVDQCRAGAQDVYSCEKGQKV